MESDVEEATSALKTEGRGKMAETTTLITTTLETVNTGGSGKTEKVGTSQGTDKITEGCGRRSSRERSSDQNPSGSHESQNPSGDGQSTSAERRKTHVLRNLAAQFRMMELEPTLNKKEIQKQYRRQALQKQPDKPTGSHELMLQLNNALDKILAEITVLEARHPEFFTNG